ncbi:MAG: magnesium/cobalt transporter CorA [Dehalococcoidia bacterium]|nr:magnesium/cobalt transporter CorA [Dehalococcoidia bacterium]
MTHRKRSIKSGLPPGSLIHIGEDQNADGCITVIDYAPAEFTEKTFTHVEECFTYRDKASTTWINVDGLHKTEVIGKLGTHFGLHPLIQEDILNTEQRPKTEDYGSYLYIILRMLAYDQKNRGITSKQVSLVLGQGFVISFQEAQDTTWNPVRERIRNNKGLTRKIGADYLAYSLMDAIVDNYFAMMEKLGEYVEDVEDELITAPSEATLKTVRDLKREMITIRKAVWPLRDMVRVLQDTDNPLITPTTKIYLRDIYDHAIQVIDNIESTREIISGMLDVYFSSASNRLNEIVKVLTILSAIFIPLTFIAGVYGMNFDFMPELNQPYGYPIVLVFMAMIAAGLIIYFKHKKWF